MRIELNSGGLQGNAVIDQMREDMSVLIRNALTLQNALDRIRAYIYYMNGGVGRLADALAEIDKREQAEQRRVEQIQEANQLVEEFIEHTRRTDKKVADMVTKNRADVNGVSGGKVQGFDSQEAARMASEIEKWLAEFGSQLSSLAAAILEAIRQLLEQYAENGGSWQYDDEVFPINGEEYGGNQIGPLETARREIAEAMREPNRQLASAKRVHTNTMLDIIRQNTGQRLNDLQLEDYLAEVNHNGCEYTALTNSIFRYYLSRPNGEEEFYRKFGYHMRDADGNLNYNYLIVDLYSRWGKHRGLQTAEEKELFEALMKDPGKDGHSSVDVVFTADTSGKMVTPENVDELLRSGKHIMIGIYNINLYDEQGNARRIGGHGMTVTGVTEDGRYIVSSWGKRYYVDPKDVGGQARIDFEIIEYK